MCTDGQTDMTKLTVAFRNLTYLTRSHFLSIFSQTQKVSTTQVGNLIALNQEDSKQRNKIFANCFESRIMETELNREKNGLEGNGNHILQLHRFLVHYYYYVCFHLYTRYLQLYTWNKPCLYCAQCCSCSVFTVCATCNVILNVKYVLYLYITVCVQCTIWLFSVIT